MKTFFTADLHFGCDHLRKHTRAEYRTIEDHDEAILHNLNQVVMRRDHIVILGDFCLKKPGRYRQRIRCRHITYILGNHCKEAQVRAVFGQQVYQQRIIKGEHEQFFCNHYPVSYWDRCHYGMAALYGHIHDNLEKEAIMDKAFPGRRSMDVGVDAAKRLLGEHRPFSEAEVLSFIGDRPGHEELWRDIPGWEGFYQVSTQGRVRSVTRTTSHTRFGTWTRKSRILCPVIRGKTGYSSVSLSKEGVKQTHNIHSLVLLAFKGPSNGLQALHGPGGLLNNSLPNLRYGTAKENQADRVRDGTKGYKAVRRSDGKVYPSVIGAAKDTGCCVSSISKVCRGERKTCAGFTWEYINAQ